MPGLTRGLSVPAECLAPSFPHVHLLAHPFGRLSFYPVRAQGSKPPRRFRRQKSPPADVLAPSPVPGEEQAVNLFLIR